MERRFKGTLVATAAGAVMLTAASAEAAFCVAGGTNGGTGIDKSCAINVDADSTNGTPDGVSYVALRPTSGSVGAFGLLGLVDSTDGLNVRGSALNFEGQPDQSKIAELKLGAGEIDNLDQFVPLGKIDIPENTADTAELSNFDPLLSVGDFSLVSGNLVSGVIEYSGPDLSILNIALKDGRKAGPAAVYAAFDVESGAQFTYDYERGALSNLQFSTVPLPAAAWLMLGGLGLIGGIVARNRRAVRVDI